MAKSSNPNQVSKLYQTVIDDVIANIREAFLDDGVDDQVLQELKQTWEAKVVQSKAVQTPAEEARHAPGAGMPMYVYANTTGGVDALSHQVVYRTLPGGQNIQMTGAGQQAAMALPGNIVYHPPQASTSQGQLYASYQPSTHQNTSQSKVVLTTQKPVPTSSDVSNQAQPQVHQIDGSADCQPCTSSSCQTVTSSISRGKILKTRTKNYIPQVDGNVGSSSEDEDDDDDDDEDDDEEEDEDEKAEKEEVVDEDPLCSDDDGSDEDPVELFDTDNVVVCQYDKIHRTKSRWKFHLKVGIMNLDGKDFVFQRATGEADW